MTDDTNPEPATVPDGDAFMLVPTPAWAHDVEQRLADLEDAPGTVSAAVDTSAVDDLEKNTLAAFRVTNDRGDRFRSDIELLKTRFNQLLDYVVQAVPASEAATPDPIPAAEAGQ